MNFFQVLGDMFRQVAKDFSDCFKPIPRRQITPPKRLKYESKGLRGDAEKINKDWQKVLKNIPK